MPLRVDIGFITAALLLSIRVGAAALIAPTFGSTRLPGPVRVWLAVVLAIVLMPALDTAPAVILSLGQLVGAVFTELFIGAILGFGFLAAYSAAQVAGRILDVQVGFGVANILNPSTETFAPLLGTLFGMLVVVIYLAMDGHHVLIEAVALSARATPPGTLLQDVDWEAIVTQSGVMFTYALAIAGPVMLMLLLVDLAMAVISRSMPQLNVFVLSFTVKIVVGLMVLAATIPMAGGVYRSLVETTFRYWVAGDGPVP